MSQVESVEDLLTKAVGDITAALMLAGLQGKIADWTAPYVAAINKADATRIEDATPADTGQGVVQADIDMANDYLSSAFRCTATLAERFSRHRIAHPTPTDTGLLSEMVEALDRWVAYDECKWDDNITGMIAAYENALRASRTTLAKVKAGESDRG